MEGVEWSGAMVVMEIAAWSGTKAEMGAVARY